MIGGFSPALLVFILRLEEVVGSVEKYYPSLAPIQWADLQFCYSSPMLPQSA
jgi:hypothetical protein